MKRSGLNLLCAAIITGISATPAMAQTSYHEAQVLTSTPIYHVVETSVPTRQCWEEEVVRSSSRHHYRSHTPGLLGAVIGGAIGNAVGHSNTNKKVGTIVGAMLGGSIARDMAESSYYPEERLETVERCKTVTRFEQEEKLVGYDVVYRYNGEEFKVRMPEDPGVTVRVRVNVEPVI